MRGIAPSPEVFPKQGLIDDRKRIGNFVRLPGVHPTKNHLSKIWAGGQWPGLEALLEFKGADFGLVPKEALSFVQNPISTKNQTQEQIAKKLAFYKMTATPRPGDIYNAKATWDQILEPRGWAFISGDKWWRPGKDRGTISATTNYEGCDCLFIFSDAPEIPPLKPREAYSKFRAYAVLEHGGDFTEAARAVVKDGFVWTNPSIEEVEKQISGCGTPREINLYEYSRTR